MRIPAIAATVTAALSLFTCATVHGQTGGAQGGGESFTFTLKLTDEDIRALQSGQPLASVIPDRLQGMVTDIRLEYVGNGGNSAVAGNPQAAMFPPAVPSGVATGQYHGPTNPYDRFAPSDSGGAFAQNGGYPQVNPQTTPQTNPQSNPATNTQFNPLDPRAQTGGGLAGSNSATGNTGMTNWEQRSPTDTAGTGGGFSPPNAPFSGSNTLNPPQLVPPSPRQNMVGSQADANANTGSWNNGAGANQQPASHIQPNYPPAYGNPAGYQGQQQPSGGQYQPPSSNQPTGSGVAPATGNDYDTVRGYPNQWQQPSQAGAPGLNPLEQMRYADASNNWGYGQVAGGTNHTPSLGYVPASPNLSGLPQPGGGNLVNGYPPRQMTPAELAAYHQQYGTPSQPYHLAQAQQTNLPALNIAGNTATDEGPTVSEKDPVPSPAALAEANRTNAFLFFWLMCSIGLNIYLGWISRGFYVRYRELADDLRETFSTV